MHGVIDLDQFETRPEVGQQYEFSLESLEGDHWLLARQRAHAIEIWNHLKEGDSVSARVIGFSTKGLDLKIGPVSAFMPASQVDFRLPPDLGAFSGQVLQCRVIEVNRRKHRLVLSRRALLAEEQRGRQQSRLSELKVGQIVHGKVEKLEAYGAFIDLGEDLSGLLHISNISHQRLKHPCEALSVGQELDVKVLEVQGLKKIGLGLKQTIPDPWEEIQNRYAVGRIFSGKVKRTAEFGAFIELEPRLEGLVHISQISNERVAKVDDVLKVGQEVRVRVLQLDRERHRISLTCLNEEGGRIGANDPGSDDPEYRQRVYKMGSVPVTGTNLGDVLRRALKQK